MNWSRQPVKVVATPEGADPTTQAWSSTHSAMTQENRQAFVTRTYWVSRTGSNSWGVHERSCYVLHSSPWARGWSAEDTTDINLLLSGPSVASELALSLAESAMVPDEWDGRAKD